MHDIMLGMDKIRFFLIGMGSQACGFGFLILYFERVLFMITAPNRCESIKWWGHTRK